MDITQQLSEILKRHNGSAFLFIGSGFSRRYLGLEDWERLLTKFSITKNFSYYIGRANKDLAEAAKLLSDDFYEEWWNNPTYENNRNLYSSMIEHRTTPLRIEISEYLKNINTENAPYKNNMLLSKEIKLLASLNLDGIITTNWDLFLESLFPDYHVFVGQTELLFSNLQEIGEIYKIHGCANNPNSLVLTSDDYHNFQTKNSYLAAKLITIFMEHPIIFIGYSLSDKNIQSILQSIVHCLDDSNLEKLRNNLIFLKRLSDGESEEIIQHTMTFSGSNISLPTTLIKTDDFSKVYEAIYHSKKKLPVKLLRYFKEQFYELAYSATATEKIVVVDEKNIDDYSNIEFVIGLGLKEKLGYSKIGYAGLDVKEIMKDIISDNIQYEPYNIITMVIAKKINNTKYIPIFKYLNELKITSLEKYEEFKQDNQINLDKLVLRTQKQLQYNNKYTKQSFERSGCVTLNDVLNLEDVNSALLYLPFLDFSAISNDDLNSFKLFLNTHKEIYLDKNIENSIHITAFKKAIVLYDKLKYGW